MKIIYISLPITGHEDTYERRLNAAVRYVKAKFHEYDRIITPKEVAENLEKEYHPLEPKLCLVKLGWNHFTVRLSAISMTIRNY